MVANMNIPFKNITMKDLDQWTIYKLLHYNQVYYNKYSPLKIKGQDI